MIEIWRDIEGFEDYYQISNKGRIWSKLKNKILLQTTTKKGYLMFETKIRGKKECFLTHRLVAKTFLGDITDKVIHHINHNKKDNSVENLKILSPEEHMIIHCQILSVSQYTLDNTFVAKFDNISEAEKTTGINRNYICRCANGTRKTGGGYVWRYNS